MKRKIEHLEICLRDDVVFKNNCKKLFNEIILIHQALPGLKFSEIDLSTKFLGRELKAPIIIESMTGGHIHTKTINENLAKLAEEYGIAIAVGSQRPVVKYGFKPEIVETYKVVRDVAPTVPVLGNIGIAQLHELSLDVVKSLVDTIKADALVIHLNPAQEIIQPEGDHDFGLDLLIKVSELVKNLDIPIVIKEVGNGLSKEVVSLFKDIGIRFFDVAGSCGTNWIKIESYRNPKGTLQRELGMLLSKHKWGIPTPLSLIETRAVAPSSTVIASGGMWNGVYAAKSLILGANLVGFARPVLKALVENGYEGAKLYISKYILELKTLMFLIGARSINELCIKPLVLGPIISNYMTARGINVKDYIEKIRCGVV